MKRCTVHLVQACCRPRSLLLTAMLSLVTLSRLVADSDVYLLSVPDYDWHAGCVGTASGNLFGYWDRNGFPNFYTGPTANGVAPLSNCGTNIGIESMWASQAGFDGRPADKLGHLDDYWAYYTVVPACPRNEESRSHGSTAADPYLLAGRAEHEWDCICDFIGMSQKKWTNMNGECDGNIDGYVFVYWDSTGNKRVNYTPPPDAGLPAVDLQSGLRAWSQYRGYNADVFTQLAAHNPHTPPGQGFTWEELKQEINAGYPVLAFLQNYSITYRSLGNMARANPEIHGMMIYGYKEVGTDVKLVRCRTSWASGDQAFYQWDAIPWLGEPVNLSLRGVIGYHPKPKITAITKGSSAISISWDGPSAQLYDALTRTTTDLHWYVVERSETLDPPQFVPVGPATTQRSVTIPDDTSTTGFYRVRMVEAP